MSRYQSFCWVCRKLISTQATTTSKAAFVIAQWLGTQASHFQTDKDAGTRFETVFKLFKECGRMCRPARESVSTKKASAELEDETSEVRLRTGSSVTWHIKPPGARVIHLKFELLLNPSKFETKKKSEVQLQVHCRLDCADKSVQQVTVYAGNSDLYPEVYRYHLSEGEEYSRLPSQALSVSTCDTVVGSCYFRYLLVDRTTQRPFECPSPWLMAGSKPVGTSGSIAVKVSLP